LALKERMLYLKSEEVTRRNSTRRRGGRRRKRSYDIRNFRDVFSATWRTSCLWHWSSFVLDIDLHFFL